MNKQYEETSEEKIMKIKISDIEEKNLKRAYNIMLGPKNKWCNEKKKNQSFSS